MRLKELPHDELKRCLRTGFNSLPGHSLSGLPVPAGYRPEPGQALWRIPFVRRPFRRLPCTHRFPERPAPALSPPGPVLVDDSPPSNRCQGPGLRHAGVGHELCIASHAHYYLMLHAAVLERNGRALIMPGDPGAGKSTSRRPHAGRLAPAVGRDRPDRSRRRTLVWPRPSVSLKNASIDIIRAHSTEAVLGDAARDTHKGTVAHLRPSTLSLENIAVQHTALGRFPALEGGRRRASDPALEGCCLPSSGQPCFQLQPIGRPWIPACRGPDGRQ